MKKILRVACLLFLTINASAQVDLPAYADSIFSTYYRQRATHFKTLPQTKGDIIFLGNSITDGAEWNELFICIKYEKYMVIFLGRRSPIRLPKYYRL